MRILLTLALFGAATWSWAAGTAQSTLTVSAIILPVGCPAGETAPSCAPSTPTMTTAKSYVVARPALGEVPPLTLQKVEGEVVVITVAY